MNVLVVRWSIITKTFFPGAVDIVKSEKHTVYLSTIRTFDTKTEDLEFALQTHNLAVEFSGLWCDIGRLARFPVTVSIESPGSTSTTVTHNGNPCSIAYTTKRPLVLAANTTYFITVSSNTYYDTPKFPVWKYVNAEITLEHFTLQFYPYSDNGIQWAYGCPLRFISYKTLTCYKTCPIPSNIGL